jgi:hypothetical protein
VAEFFFLTLACTWAVLIPARLWPKTSSDFWARRLTMLTLGLGIGLGAMWLEGYSWPALAGNEAKINPEAPYAWFDRVSPPRLELPFYVSYLSYFGLVFFFMRWWRLAEVHRPKRFRWEPIVMAAFWAAVFWLLLPPSGRVRAASFLTLVTTAAAVQIVSPCKPATPSPRKKRLRLPYSARILREDRP